MTEVSSVAGNALKLRYQASYAFAEKVIHVSAWVWYAGIVVVLLQAIMMWNATTKAREMLRNMNDDGMGLSSMQILTFVSALSVTLVWFYAGSLALGALGRLLKANVDSAVNTSRDLSDYERKTLLLSA